MKKLLETVTKFPQTQVWNDSCSCNELSYAIENGAVGATTNPVIVLNVLKKELKEWEPTIEKIIADNPTFSEDEVAWEVIKSMGAKASKLLYPIFKETNGQKGRISFQTNAKFYNNAAKMVEHACDLAATVENSQVKAPASKAGIEAYEEMTYRGVSINATVSFTVSQAIAVAEAVERGLKRREAEGLPTDTMHPVCTIMAGRVDDYLKNDIKAKGIVDECVSELATMLADIAHTVDPHCFVLGGGVMKSKKYFYDQLVEQFNAKIHVGMRGHIPILERELEDCGAIGAAMLPMSKLK